MQDGKAKQVERLLEERRFFFSRMLQAVAIYFALFGFAVRELMQADDPFLAWLLGISLLGVHAAALYVAYLFDAIIQRLSIKIQEHDGDHGIYGELIAKGVRTIYPVGGLLALLVILVMAAVL